MHAKIPFLVAVALGTAACGGRDPVADDANNAAVLPGPEDVAGANSGAASADGSPPSNLTADSSGGAGAPAPASAAIPPALHGRWGMTPADCTSTRGDAKGLITVGASELRFYESVARPARNVETSSESISADFDFTGEGQNWSKFQTMTVEGDKLVRTESSPMASFTYVRCR